MTDKDQKMKEFIDYIIKDRENELIREFIEKIRIALNELAPDESTWGIYEIMDYLDKLIKEYQGWLKDESNKSR
jgi:hypothetical protein